MDMKKIIQCLIILLVISMTFACIYACEIDDVSNGNSSDGSDGLYISGSGDVCHISKNTHEAHQHNNIDTIVLHI